MRTAIAILASSLLLLLLWVSPLQLHSQAGEVFSGEVVGVTDGDTVRVMRDRTPVRVRLDGIDAPETRQPFFQRAKQLTSRFVFGKVARVEVRDVDQYGRLVARVYVDELDLSLALVEQGLAWHFTRYSDDQTLAEAERAARAAGVGLWRAPNPVPPWEFRRGFSAVSDVPVEGQLHGNTRSRVFHRPGCPNYDCPNCVVPFDSPEAAVAAGFRPAGDCHDRSSQAR